MGETILFYIFGGLAIGMVVLMIVQSNPISSALCLVLALFGLAGLYVLLSAPFVAVLQILVYAGAIMVLFIFVIMLLKLRPQDLIDDKMTWGRLTFFILALVFMGFLGFYIMKVQASPFQELADLFGAPKNVGNLIFTDYLIPFELTSVLLLIAIVGVVVLAKKR